MDMRTKRLREAFEQSGLTQTEVCERTGINKGAFSSYLSGRYFPKQIALEKLSNLFNVPIKYLMGIDDRSDYVTSSTKGVSIPILGSITAGIPIDAIEDIIGYEDVPLEMAKTGTIYGLRVKGHSMEPRIWEGDIVILRWQSDVDSGDIATILINGEDVTLKKIHKSEQGITLIALNPSVYEPHFYTNQEVEDLPVTVVGKVLEVRGTL